MRFIVFALGKLRVHLLVTLLLVVVKLNAQFEAVDIDGGSNESQVTDIIVVFKMHVDVGYTDWGEGVLQKYTGSMLDETLRSLEVTADLPKEEQFVWTIPGWPLKYIMENSPENKGDALGRAIQNGRVVPHAFAFNVQTEASDLESMVRGFSYTSDLNRGFGLPEARDAKFTDVPSHSWALPTLLSNAGVDLLHIGCNPGSASPKVPTLFWWKGPDGSKLMTFYWSEYYGSGILPPKNWPYKTWLAMIHTHENTGSPSPEDVAKLLKETKKKLPNVNIKMGRLSDFYDKIMEEGPDLPVVEGDMPDTWIHGYMSNPIETKLSKKLQRKTFHVETLGTMMKQWGVTSNSEGELLQPAIENMLLYDEHTFGAALSHGNQHKWTYNDEFKVNKALGHYDYLEATWVEKRNRIRKAQKIVEAILNRKLKKLASSVNVDGKRIVVYNPSAWERGGRVNMFAGVYAKDFHIYGLKDLSTGKITRVYDDKNLLTFDVEAIPAQGYKTYIPILEPIADNQSIVMDKTTNIIENKYFKLQIDKEKGTIKTLVDKQNGRELVNRESEYGFGAYFLERPGQRVIDLYNKNYIKPGAENWAKPEMIRSSVPYKETKIFKGGCNKITYLDMGNAVRATVWCKLGDKDEQSYLMSYTLYENQPYVEINWGVDGKKPNALPEAGWISFSFNVDSPDYRLYRTGGIVNPKTDLLENSNTDYHFLNTSMTLFDADGNGIGLNSPESPAVSIDAPGLFQFTGDKKPKTANVFVNLFNNQWGTNFSEWIEGSFSSKMYLWSYKEYDSEKSFITPSEETRVPLQGVYYDGKAGVHPTSQNGIGISKKGVLVTAFYKSKEGTILRLWEQAGKDGACTVKLTNGGSFERAYRCDLRNNVIDSIGVEIVDDSFSYDLKKNQPVTFILK
ncbi:glycoside hydrolase family 38 N-terminal domain-containing protein [Aestuariivivens insulae]|uniref:glycoside hydrolase family 38 N-terminal domain-containing protein n=1 Tax=Aestuariivivens insulae TaxID=1621988 RepID=UPI001F56BB0F|nr:glycoside hydrolase family 38 C-terminal domain-containing protein [Aestuariivivens insulae]